MRVAYLCPSGHLTVGLKDEKLSGGLPADVGCVHCNLVAKMFEPFTMLDSVPCHFEFYRPKYGQVVSIEEEQLLKRNMLLIRLVEDPIITKEFQCAKALSKLTKFLVMHIALEDRLPDVVDTAIRDLERYYTANNLKNRKN